MLKWLDNFWYHHKWAVIISSFFAVFILIGIVQMATRTEYDLKMVYAGPSVMIADEKAEKVRTVFAGFVEKDITGDGKKTVLLNAYSVLSDEQLKHMNDEAKKENDSVYYDSSLRENAIKDVSTLLATGEVTICLFDEYVYGRFAGRDFFVALSDVLGYKPEQSYDDYAVRVGDTDFGKFFMSDGPIPDDTLICIRKPAYLTGTGDSKEMTEEYETALTTFAKILRFKAPE